MAEKEKLAKTIAGEVTMADKPGETLRKWREIFGLTQKKIAETIGTSQPVISDYEAGRRNPGQAFTKKYVQALIKADVKEGGKILGKFTPEKNPQAILDIREFLTPIPLSKFVKKIDAKIIASKPKKPQAIMGYTVIDSLNAILEMTEKEFANIYGASPQRALIFTKVNIGRSPLVAVKVTAPKPSLIVLHGISPEKVDRLAVKIAESIQVPLAVTSINTPEKIIEKLRNK